MHDPDRALAGLRRFLKGLEVLPFTDTLAYRFGEENARLQAAGTTISQFDLAIAVTALHHNLTLATENRRHYERISGLKLESLKTHP
jgi:tRNA(fMet)-specific endonuclease VapC